MESVAFNPAVIARLDQLNDERCRRNRRMIEVMFPNVLDRKRSYLMAGAKKKLPELPGHFEQGDICEGEVAEPAQEGAEGRPAGGPPFKLCEPGGEEE